MGRAALRTFISLLILGILIAIGGGIYQAGVTQGIVDAGRVPVGAAVGVAGYGWGFHPFGFLGLFFPLLFLFLLFGALRATFWRGRGWSHRHGDGDWRGWRSEMHGGPEGWRAAREQHMADLHRRLHEEELGGSRPDGGTPSSGPAGG
jgi:hypothetical protein